MNRSTCPPCFGDCNQGRDCPAHPMLHRAWLGDLPTGNAIVSGRRENGDEFLLATSLRPLDADVCPPIPEPSGVADCAIEGGTFRAPAPARVPRARPMFKTDAEMRADGWEPANLRETLLVLGTPVAILLAVGAVWVIATWGGK